MKILVYGSHKFDNYETFMRGVVVAIDNLITDATTNIEVLTAGPYKINNFSAEFCNRTQQYFKQKGIKIKFSKVAHSDVMQNFEQYNISYVLLFMQKSDIVMTLDSMIHKAEEFNVNSSIYKY